MRKYIRLEYWLINLIILLISLTPLQLYSTENDSVKRQEVINVIVEGLKYMNDYQFDSAIYLFNKADSMSIAINNIKFRASCQYNLGVTHYRNGDYAVCGDFFNKALELCEQTNDSVGLAQYQLSLGILHKRKGDYEKATNLVLQSLGFFKRNNKNEFIASSYNTLAGIQMSVGNDALSLKYYNLSSFHFNLINDSLNIGRIYNNIGIFYLHRNQLDSAIKYFNQSVKTKVQYSDSTEAIKTINNLGDAYLKKKNLKKAKYYYNQAYHLALKSSSIYDHFDIENAIAEVYLAENKAEEAIVYLNKGRELAEHKKRNKILLRNLKLSIDAYKRIGKYEEALRYTEQYIFLNQEIFDVEKTQNVNDLQFKYETEKKDLQISNLNEINVLKTKSIQTRNWGLIIISIFLLILIILVVLVYRSYKLKKRAHEYIRFLMHEKQHRTKNNLQLLSSVLALQSEASSNENKEVVLTGENRVQSIVVLDKLLYEENKEGDEIDISLYIDEILLGLLEAYNSNDQIMVNQEIESIMIAAEQAKYIGLLINELITNSFKYAITHTEKPQLDLKLHHFSKNTYELIIRDNGPGLPTNYKEKSTSSLGMKLIETMGKQLKGTYKIENREGFYYQLHFEIKKRG